MCRSSEYPRGQIDGTAITTARRLAATSTNCAHAIACGVEVLRRVRERGAKGTWIVAATAHPAKFDSIVEPLIGRPVPVPPMLAELLARPSRAEPLAPTLEALRGAIGS